MTAELREDQRGDIVLGWLTKVVAVLAVFGLVLFDAASIGVAKVSAQDDANEAASAAADSWRSQQAVQPAYDAAWAVADSHGETVSTTDFHVDKDGTVHLRVHKTATTLVLSKIGPLEHWAEISATGVGRSIG